MVTVGTTASIPMAATHTRSGLRSLQAAAAGGLAAGVLLLPLQRLLLSRDTDKDVKAAGMCAGPGARSAVWLLSAVIDMVGPGHM